MDTDTLKKIRSAFPGGLIILGFTPLYTYITATQISDISPASWLITGALVVAAYGLGMIYNVYCVRALFNHCSHKKITDNIKQRLIAMGRTSPISSAKREQLMNSTVLMDIFYSLIDSKESLKEKSKLVRENGLIWGCAADLTVLGSLFSIFYFPVYLSTNYPLFLYWITTSLITSLVFAFIIHPKTEIRHIELSNEQLDYIESQLKKEVTEKVDVL